MGTDEIIPGENLQNPKDLAAAIREHARVKGIQNLAKAEEEALTDVAKISEKNRIAELDGTYKVEEIPDAKSSLPDMNVKRGQVRFGSAPDVEIT